MKSEAYRDCTRGISSERSFQRQAVGIDSYRYLNAVAKREDGEKITRRPFKLSRNKILPGTGDFPREQRPRYTMHRKPMLVEMKKWRRQIKNNPSPQNAIPGLGQPIRPWIEKRDSGGASSSRGCFEVFHASEKFHALMTKRSTEHSASGEKNRLEITRDEFVGGRVVHEARRSEARHHNES